MKKYEDNRISEKKKEIYLKLNYKNEMKKVMAKMENVPEGTPQYDALMEEYFPQLAEQTILLCTTSEIRTDNDYIKLEPFISKTYTLHRDVEEQKTTVSDGYFGIELNQ